MTFPQYRKYLNVNTWFKITSADHFTEIKQIGSRFLKSEIDAVQFPEKLMIQDMLSCHEGRWEIISSDQFAEVESQTEI